jgi:hypothetical protein
LAGTLRGEVALAGLPMAGNPLRIGDSLRLELLLPGRADPVAVAANVADDGTLRPLDATNPLGRTLAAAGPLPVAGSSDDELGNRIVLLVNETLGERGEVKVTRRPRLIRIGDALRVTLNGSQQVLSVAGDGRIKLPVIRDPVMAANLTPSELADVIEFRYESAFTNAEATVTVQLAEASDDAASADLLIPVKLIIEAAN